VIHAVSKMLDREISPHRPHMGTSLKKKEGKFESSGRQKEKQSNKSAYSSNQNGVSLM
jgi:hypothetical protein